MTAILPPDPELFVGDYLADRPALAGVPVGREVPDPRPAEFVVIIATGTAPSTEVSAAWVITHEGWAASRERAMELDRIVHAELLAMADVLRGTDPAVYRTRTVSWPKPLPDPVSNQPRATGAVSVHLRAGSYPATESA